MYVCIYVGKQIKLNTRERQTVTNFPAIDQGSPTEPAVADASVWEHTYPSPPHLITPSNCPSTASLLSLASDPPTLS